MKNRLLAVLLVVAMSLCLTSLDSTAQSTTKKYSNSLSANPIGLLLGYANATYEQRIAKYNSFTISGIYGAYNDWSAFAVGGSYRWYLQLGDVKKIPLEGFSCGPMIVLGFWSYDPPSEVAAKLDGGSSVAIGGEAAYKWVFDDFVVEPYLNLQFNLVAITGLSYRPFSIGCNLGYAW